LRIEECLLRVRICESGTESNADGCAKQAVFHVKHLAGSSAPVNVFHVKHKGRGLLGAIIGRGLRHRIALAVRGWRYAIIPQIGRVFHVKHFFGSHL
jgi:hypothetical protein